MASAAQSLTRALSRAAPSSSVRHAAGNTRSPLARQFFQSSRRTYSSGPAAAKSNAGLIAGAGIVAAAGVGGYYYFNNKQLPDVPKIPEVHLKKGSAGETAGIFTPTKDDYQKVYDEIARLLVEKDDYDDGSYGPVLVRLAWHCSGTYDAATGTGGSNGATMRFAPEGDHGANAGLKNARDFLEPVKSELEGPR